MNKGKARWIKTCAVLTALAASLLFVSACSSSGQQTGSAEAAQSDPSAFEWGIQVKSSQVAGDLSETQTVQQYDGGVTQETVESEPGEGNVYLLLELAIEKQASDAASFEWKKLSVQDAAGNRYARMENDTFLESFGYSRIKSIDLTLGKNEGYACFEIPEESAAGDLVLVYEDTQGENGIKIR